MKVRLLCSYQTVSNGKPEVCTERNLVLVGQVEQLHSHLFLFVLNPHGFFISCVETAETRKVNQIMFKLVAFWFSIVSYS